MADLDSFAALEYVVDGMANDARMAPDDAVNEKLSARVAQLRAALAEAREALGEVTITEEWGVKRDDGSVYLVGPYRHPRAFENVVHRMVTTARREGAWEVAE